MAIVVVGGQTRNIGKTSVIAGLIAALPEAEWTAFKITQFGHGICSANGKPCSCETDCCTKAVSEERDATSSTDSSRFLAAGAARSFWVRTRQGQLGEAMPRVRKELAGTKNAIIESNSILNFLDPDLYLTVLDPTNLDFKPSARASLLRADAVLWASNPPFANRPSDEDLSSGTPGREEWGTPKFRIEPPAYVNPALIRFVAEKLSLERDLRISPDTTVGLSTTGLPHPRQSLRSR
jgi:hypothetical protein